MATRIPRGPPLGLHPCMLLQQPSSGNSPAHAPLDTLPSNFLLEGIEDSQSTEEGKTQPTPPESPKKFVLRPSDLPLWLHSEAFVRLTYFLQTVNEAARNCKCSQASIEFASATELTFPANPALKRINAILAQINALIDSTPPESSDGRYGNKSFRLFLSKLENESTAMHEILLDALPIQANISRSTAIEELVTYFNLAFGNGPRIDYGSGHETAFACWLACFSILGLFSASGNNSKEPLSNLPQGRLDQRSLFPYKIIGLVIFPNYLRICRRLQRIYSLEPAGSHGVWGLDDFQFLPFYWGASQLLDHKDITPNSTLKPEIAAHFGKDYLYLEAINEINSTKSGPFFEHSPMLYNISVVASWSKVNSGLLKMYVAEVLGRYPVVQHLMFGRLLPFRPFDNGVA